MTAPRTASRTPLCPWCGAPASVEAVNLGPAHSENSQSGVVARCPRGCAGAAVFVACDPLDHELRRLAEDAALRRFGARPRVDGRGVA